MYMAYISGWEPVMAFSNNEEKAKKLAIQKKKSFAKDDLDKWDWESVSEYYGARIEEIKEGTVLTEGKSNSTKSLVNEILNGKPVRNVLAEAGTRSWSESQTVEISLDFESGDEKTGNGLKNELKDSFNLNDSDITLNVPEGWVSAEFDEFGTVYHTPETRTGIMTGDPEEWDIEDLSTSDDIKKEVESWEKDYDFTIDKISCSFCDAHGFYSF